MRQARHRFKPLEMEPSTSCHMDLHGQERPPQLVRDDNSDEGSFVYADTFAFMVLERMQGRRGAPVFGAGASNNAVEAQNRQLRRAKVSEFHFGRWFIVNKIVDAGWGAFWRRCHRVDGGECIQPCQPGMENTAQ